LETNNQSLRQTQSDSVGTDGLEISNGVGQSNASWIVMTDPDGNEFCVMNNVLPSEPAPFHHLEPRTASANNCLQSALISTTRSRYRNRS
jgi:hypothetical protein